MCLAISISTYLFGYEFGISGNVLSHWIDDIIIIILYHSIAWSLWSTTVGKRIFNLYVVRTDGSKIGFWRALARAAAYILSSLFFGMGFLMIAFNKDKQGLHDLICDTMVVRRR